MAQTALNLSAPLDAFVEEQVASGAYPDRDAVIADAVSPVSYTHLTLPTNREV